MSEIVPSPTLPWQMSDLHPHALSLDDDAVALPDFAAQLATDLTLLSPPDIIHRYCVVAPPGDHDAALKSLGFSATRLTRLVRLPLDALADDVPKPLVTHWFKPGERAPWGQWLDAHWRHYASTHTSNPPRLPPKGPQRIFVGTDLIEGLALRDGPQGRVRSFASLRKNQDIGWIGGSPDLLRPTLCACLRRATALGWTDAQIEVDDDDRSLWSLIQTIAPTGGDTVITWQKERNPARRPH